MRSRPIRRFCRCPHPYIVPGGRFSEIYYWDTYFTLLGLEQDGQTNLADDMVSNIASLINRYGHMPNGNRSYYLSRSQPPFFSCMVDLIAEHDGTSTYATYLPAMRAEYDFWMRGARSLKPGQAHQNVVMLADGTILNRFWDDRDTPRDESYREDVETAAATQRPAAQVYRDLRAGAESGWDYSSRWLADGKTLGTVETTAILPVDLNSELFHLESDLAYAYGFVRKQGRGGGVCRARGQAGHRHSPADVGREGRRFHRLQLAEPAADACRSRRRRWCLCSSMSRRRRKAQAVAARRAGASAGARRHPHDDHRTGQQWDAPNGWAPLQWMAVQGFARYGDAGAGEDDRDAMGSSASMTGFARDGVLVEKYNVDTPPGGSAAGHGGEYALQVGFGWTNGVQAALMATYPLTGSVTAPPP